MKMNTSTIKPYVAALLLLLSLSWQPSTGFGQGAAFTFQGRLDDLGTAANGTYDLRFSLYGAASGGSLVAGPVTNASVAVSNGLFTVLLDFTPAVFDGAERWLELGV